MQRGMGVLSRRPQYGRLRRERAFWYVKRGSPFQEKGVGSQKTQSLEGEEAKGIVSADDE